MLIGSDLEINSHGGSLRVQRLDPEFPHLTKLNI
jgi:hypothetical protein